MARIETVQTLIGRFIIAKYRNQPIAQAARNLRKQGYPLAYALLVLVGRV